MKANERGAGTPILRMNNITYSGGLDLTDLKHVELPAEALEQYSVRRGDLLFNRTNSQELVGKTAVWNRDELYAFAGYLIRLRVKRHVADPSFIAAWLNTPDMKVLLRTRAKPSINMSNINATEVLTFPVVVPPLSEQRRIADVLDRAEALRAKRRAVLAQLEILSQSIFFELFGDPATNSKKWPTRALSDSCDEINDCPHSTPSWTEHGVICLRTSNLTKGDWDWADTRYVSEATHLVRSKRGVVVAGDIILSREGTVGIAAVVSPGMRVCMGQRLVQVRPSPSIHVPQFLLRHLLDVLSPSRIGQVMVGSTSQHLNVKELKTLRIPLPPVELQQDFARRADSVERLRGTHRASLAEMDALFASLQHRAFRGEL